ncbi:DUF1684 domain-containing protein [Aureimonas sp. Leaf324]|jgi:uncharacterized protein (DUF1684 family)|uniref:DUF1684 domain-containing protein n=1 Tax=Aureimonas sp. Leaf324 TaxID=1736336 RepID=UPI0006FE2886|nr:DUF1684 domain-containing protein [Aureimonas sp. Leaf324]KQQ86153.1 hypothetical protein ASF65_06455 [Aureimonas sp. Leaf324]
MSDPAATEFAAWRERRLADLARPDGWLNIVGRYPLENGTFRIGAAPDNDIVLPAGPAEVGTLTQDDTGVRFQATGDAQEQRLALSKSAPPRFSSGNLLLEVTTLNGENALRVRDTTPIEGERLPRLTAFAYDPSWRIVARWERLDAPHSVEIDTSRSIRTEVEATHRAVFEREGERYELLATHGTPERPQFVFRDATARTSETYPAARFLFGEDVADDTIVLDFNHAVSPPCAFTDFAVCPLPPPGNVLPIRIEAGEHAPAAHGTAPKAGYATEDDR